MGGREQSGLGGRSGRAGGGGRGRKGVFMTLEGRQGSVSSHVTAHRLRPMWTGFFSERAVVFDVVWVVFVLCFFWGGVFV